MEQIASRISLILAGVILLAAALALTTIQPARRVQPAGHSRGRTGLRRPQPMRRTRRSRLPQKVVFVHVEADKSDIVVGWAEN